MAFAKELLIRYAYEADLQTYRPAVREFVFTIDTEKVFMGTKEGAKQLAYIDEVRDIVEASLANRRVIYGTDTELSSKLKQAQWGYSTTLDRPVIISPKTNARMVIATGVDLLKKEPTVVIVQEDNINADDNNSVILADFRRPTILVFVNGILSTSHASDPKRYEYNEDTKVLKLYNMQAGDRIAYY